MLRFFGGNAKEVAVKFLHLLEKPTASRVDFPGAIGVGIIIRLHIPPVLRNILGRIYTMSQYVPKFFRIICTRKTAAHTNNSNTLVVNIAAAFLCRSPCRGLFHKEIRKDSLCQITDKRFPGWIIKE